MRRGLIAFVLLLAPFFSAGAIEADVVGFESVNISDEVLDDINAGFLPSTVADSGSKIILWDENGRVVDGLPSDSGGIRIEFNSFDE